MASNANGIVLAIVLCTVGSTHAQYGGFTGSYPNGHGGYAPNAPHAAPAQNTPPGVYPPNASNARNTPPGVYPPHVQLPPRGIAQHAPQSSQWGAAQAQPASPQASGYPLFETPHVASRFDGPAQMQPAGQPSAPMPNNQPSAQDSEQIVPPSPQSSNQSQATPVYGGAPEMDYGAMTQGYVQDAIANPHPAGVVMSPWGGAQFGHAHRGCGPTYGAPCDSFHGATSCGLYDCGVRGSERPGWGARLKGKVVGDGGASCDNVCGPQPSKWFAAAYGLLMKRDDGVYQPLTEDVANSSIALSTQSVDFNYQGGAEIRFGRFLNAQTAIEAAVWTLIDAQVETSILGSNFPGGLGTRIDFSTLDITQGGVPSNVQPFYDGAFTHRLRKSFSATNIELNLLQIPICGAAGCSACSSCDAMGCGKAPSNLNLSWHVGARYLRLEEAFQFATDAANGTFGDPTDEVYYDIDVENHLIGSQAGGHLFVPLTCRFSLFSDVSVGLFSNHMKQNQRIYNADGLAYVNAGPYANQDYRIRSSTNSAAVVGELRTGLNCQFTHRWRGTIVYRTIGVANVALAEQQIPNSFADIADAGRVRDHGSILLHGFMFGLETRF